MAQTAQQDRELDERYRKTLLLKQRARLLRKAANLVRKGLSETTGQIRNTQDKNADNGATVALMLIGMAIECAQKALIAQKRVYRGGTDKDIANDVSKELKNVGHDLNRGAELAGIPVDTEKQELLRVLRECIEWAGRYGAPRHAAHVTVGDEPLTPAQFQQVWPMAETYLKSAIATYDERKTTRRVEG